MKGLGIRQRRMLTLLRHDGQGHWPRGWPLRNDDRTVLAALERKGLVVPCPHRRYSLTHNGRVAASYLTGDPTHTHRKADAR